MRKSPAFTMAAVAMLAIAIGVNAIVFSVTNAALFKGFPLVVRNDRILYIDSRKNGHGCCGRVRQFGFVRCAGLFDTGTPRDAC